MIHEAKVDRLTDVQRDTLVQLLEEYKAIKVKSALVVQRIIDIEKDLAPKEDPINNIHD